jgi:uncharacterized membrane protein
MKFIASPLELILFGLFIFYLVFQIDTPQSLVPYIESGIGMAIIIGIALYMFLCTHPILGVMSIFVAYEVLRRSTVRFTRMTLLEPNPVQASIDSELKAMNPPKLFTLEEQIVSSMAPLPNINPTDYVVSSYKPVSESTHEAAEL